MQAWGSRAHFMQVRVLFFMRHWFNRWTITIRKVKYVQPPRAGYVIAPEASSDWADEQMSGEGVTVEQPGTAGGKAAVLSFSRRSAATAADSSKRLM